MLLTRSRSLELEANAPFYLGGRTWLTATRRGCYWHARQDNVIDTPICLALLALNTLLRVVFLMWSLRSIRKRRDSNNAADLEKNLPLDVDSGGDPAVDSSNQPEWETIKKDLRGLHYYRLTLGIPKYKSFLSCRSGQSSRASIRIGGDLQGTSDEKIARKRHDALFKRCAETAKALPRRPEDDNEPTWDNSIFDDDLNVLKAMARDVSGLFAVSLFLLATLTSLQMELAGQMREATKSTIFLLPDWIALVVRDLFYLATSCAVGAIEAKEPSISAFVKSFDWSAFNLAMALLPLLALLYILGRPFLPKPLTARQAAGLQQLLDRDPFSATLHLTQQQLPSRKVSDGHEQQSPDNEVRPPHSKRQKFWRDIVSPIVFDCGSFCLNACLSIAGPLERFRKLSLQSKKLLRKVSMAVLVSSRGRSRRKGAIPLSSKPGVLILT